MSYYPHIIKGNTRIQGLKNNVWNLKPKKKNFQELSRIVVFLWAL